MTTIGIVGGVGPESTVDYYRQLVAGLSERYGEAQPDILINSVQVQRMLAMATAADWDGVTAYLVRAFEALVRAGAGLGLIAANTPHMVFDRVAAAVPIPLVSIVEATRDEAVRLGLRRPLLLGTRFTMEATFYPDAFARLGLGMTVPSPDDRTLVHGIYVGELLQNQFRPESRDVIVQLVERMQRTDGIDAVILGGTELPLLLRGALDGIIPALDTTSLHVQAVAAQVGSRK